MNLSFSSQLKNIIDEYVKAHSSPDGDFPRVVRLTTEFVANLDLSLYSNDCELKMKSAFPSVPTSAKTLFAAMILYLMERSYTNSCINKLTMHSIYCFFLECSELNAVEKGLFYTQLDELFQQLPDSNPAKLVYISSKYADLDCLRPSVILQVYRYAQIFSKPENSFNC